LLHANLLEREAAAPAKVAVSEWPGLSLAPIEPPRMIAVNLSEFGSKSVSFSFSYQIIDGPAHAKEAGVRKDADLMAYGPPEGPIFVNHSRYDDAQRTYRSTNVRPYRNVP
jgi:hypothetical protein